MEIVLRGGRGGGRDKEAQVPPSTHFQNLGILGPLWAP